MRRFGYVGVALLIVSSVTPASAQPFGGGGGGMPGGGGGGGGYSPGGGGRSPGGYSPSPGGYSPGGYRPGGYNPGGNHQNGYDPRPNVPTPGGYNNPYNNRPGYGPQSNVPRPGQPYVPAPTSSWQVRNPMAGESRILPSSGRVDLSHSVAPAPRGGLPPEVQKVRNFARTGNMAEVTNHLNRQAQGPGNLDTMFATVNALHGIQNPAYQTFRTNTLNLARSQIAQNANQVMPWVVVAQMSLQDRNAQQFEDATRQLIQKFPNSEYSHFYQGVQHLQNRNFAEAQAALEQARALGMPEESIAELLKTAIDNQKWIWEYAIVLSIVVAAWLVGIAGLYLVGKLFSRRTLAGLNGDLDALSASDRRLRKWYRAVITFAGFYYYLSLPMLVVVAVALPLAFGYAMLMVPYFNLLLVGLVFVLGLGGIITAISGLRTAFLRAPDGDDGRVVTTEQAPALWAAAREVAELVGTRPIDEIRLTAGTDICVYEKGSYLAKLRDRGRRVLILGLGTMDAMPLESLKAILAHEYGHFHHRDTAGGDVALRVYQAMDNFALAIVLRGKIQWWDVAVRFLVLYHRIFRRLTFGASRLQEIYADKLAVSHYGAAAFRRGLTHVIRRSIEIDWALNKALSDVVRSGVPAMNFYQHTPSPNLVEREELETVVAEIIARPTNAEDSHPGPQDRFKLAERIAGAKRPPCNLTAMSLVESNPQLLGEMNHYIDEKIAERAKLVLEQCHDNIRLLTTVLSHGMNPDALYERARIYCDKGDYAQALVDLNELNKIAPEAMGIVFLRGITYAKLQNHAQAVNDLATVAKAMIKEANDPKTTIPNFDDKDLFQVLLKLGESLMAAGRHKEALNAFGRALQKQPNSLAALIGRGRAHRHLQAVDHAVVDFTTAAGHWPTSPEPLVERAQAYELQGRSDLATADRRAAADIDRRLTTPTTAA